MGNRTKTTAMVPRRNGLGGQPLGAFNSLRDANWNPPTVTCPDCGLAVPVRVMADSALEAHRGKQPCLARMADNGARSNGWFPLHEMEIEPGRKDYRFTEDMIQCIRAAGVKNIWVPSVYYDGTSDKLPQAVDMLKAIQIPVAYRRGRSCRISVPWIPVWTLQVWKDCYESGDDLETALRAWKDAGAESRAGMLGDIRLLNDD